MTRLMEKGFTLIELMVTLVIVAILVGIAMPRFRDISEQVNFTSVQQSLTSSLFLARSESVKRGLMSVFAPVMMVKAARIHDEGGTRAGSFIQTLIGTVYTTLGQMNSFVTMR